MSLGNISGTIGSLVGVAFTLGALGLTLEFVNRAVDRATPQPQGKRRKYKPVFEIGNNQGNSSNLFNPMGSKAKGKGKQSAYDNFMGGYSY